MNPTLSLRLFVILFWVLFLFICYGSPAPFAVFVFAGVILGVLTRLLWNYDE